MAPRCAMPLPKESLAHKIPCVIACVGSSSAIRASAHVASEQALAHAQHLDSGPALQSLHGVSIGVKDVLLTSDMPTRYNCAFYHDNGPAHDAAAVAILRNAGAVMIGKTETVELASVGAPPRTRNPHNIAHTPGGSSSGSAAAVADCHVPIALGTQTGGSIMRPASFCGVWAMKPTWGLVPAEGAKSFAPSLDTIGWFARSARDLALVLDVFEPRPSLTAAALEGARIGVWRMVGWEQATGATKSAMADAMERLARAGVHITELALPPSFNRLAEAHLMIMMAEGARSFLAEYRIAPKKLHPRIAAMVCKGETQDRRELLAAYDLAAQARAEFDSIAGALDGVLCPSTLGEAPTGLASTGDLIFNGAVTLLHAPCINMPLWQADNGLPVGLTLAGPRFADRKLAALAVEIGHALPSAQSRSVFVD